MYIVVTILVAITALIATNFSIVHNGVKFEFLSATQFQNSDKTEIKQALLAGDIGSNIITDTSGDDKLNWGTSDKSSGFSESPMFYYEEG